MKRLFYFFGTNALMKSATIAVFLFFGSSFAFAQTQSGCDIDFPNNFDNQVNFSAIYNPALCPSVTIT